MKFTLLHFGNLLRQWFDCQEGQDLVEYALIVALIALAATAGMNTLASDIASAFSSIGSTVSSAV
jgi:pilus assembly protein Flp/PilA